MLTRRGELGSRTTPRRRSAHLPNDDHFTRRTAAIYSETEGADEGGLLAGGGEWRYADNSVWCYGCAAALAVDHAKIITGTMSEAFSIACFVRSKT